MNHLKFTRDSLDVGIISNMASSECCESVSVYVGNTCDNFEGKKVANLEYEAHEPMALKQLEIICKELRSRWPNIVNIVIYHRLGLVGIKEASVVIAISSPHRESSLNAVSTAIDDLKKRVPVWKKEFHAGDEVAVGSCNRYNIFNESMCCVEDPHQLPNQFVQISVPETEIKRRIECFVEKKRDEINLLNIMDFTYPKQINQENVPQNDLIQDAKEVIENESMTCARAASVVVKQDSSKCHLKVRRVDNNIGPQTQPNYLNALDKLMMISTERENSEYFHACKNDVKQILSNCDDCYMLKYPTILERLANIEEYLNIPKSKMEKIYQRLKVVEDRLLYLESISPEYGNFLVDKHQHKNTTGESSDIDPHRMSVYQKRQYSFRDIDTIAQSLEQRNLDHESINK